MSWLYASQWLLLLWIAASRFDAVTAGNICNRTVNTREDVKASCSQWPTYTIFQGYNIEDPNSNLKKSNDSELSQQLLKWSQNPDESPDCVYYRYKDDAIIECCEGWTGVNCDDPICDPPCANDGWCLTPGVCSCSDQYTGIGCLDDTTAVSDTEKYCYSEQGCTGKKANKVSYVVSKDDCCNSYNGMSWGLDGYNCEACKPKQSYEFNDYIPDQPHVVEEKVSLPYRTCLGTGPNYYRTFDGMEYLYTGRCTYLLYSDGITRVTGQKKNCHLYSRCSCVLTITCDSQDTIVAEGSNITSNGVPVDVQEYQGWASPSGKVHLEKKGDFYYLKYGLFIVRWDIGCFWTLTSQKQPRPINSTTISGLCGNCDGQPLNDIVNRYGQSTNPTIFGNSFNVYDGSNSKCPDAPVVTNQCNSTTTYAEASKKCLLVKREPFSICHNTVDPTSYYQRCMNDYCAASTESDPTLRATEQKTVICNAFTAYAQVCTERGVHDLSWRTTTLCPKSCPYQMEYSECLTTCVKTCTNMYVVKRISDDSSECFSGCRCPDGMVLDDDVCKAPESCPCQYQGKKYEPGNTVLADCNICTCKNAQWVCTGEQCPKTCTVAGMGHIDTFDGKEYNFYGPPCTYTAFQMRSDAPEVPKAGVRSVSFTTLKNCENSQYSDNACLESVAIEHVVDSRVSVITISISDENPKFIVKQDGNELTNLFDAPVVIDSVFIRQSYSYVQLFAPGCVIVVRSGYLWVRLVPWYRENIQGLCGDMDGSVDNEYTSKNQIPESLAPYAISYSDCSYADYNEIDFCKYNSKAISLTENCYHMMINFSAIFPGCSLPIEELRFWHDGCKQDVCGMGEGVKSACSAYDNIGKKCCEQGVAVDWISHPSLKFCLSDADYSCSLPTQVGLTYQTGPSAIRTCRDVRLIRYFDDKEAVCVSDCACSPGLLLDDSGSCVPISSCTCIDNRNATHGPGEIIRQGCRNCTCVNGTWACGEKNCTITTKCPSNQVYLLSRSKCNSSCANYGLRCDYSEELKEQCGCKEPLVLDPSGKCISPENCPCSYNSEYHLPGATVSVTNGQCVCIARDWECTMNVRNFSCCSASGDPHYDTFDGMSYTYQGNCEYVLTETTKNPWFQTTVSNVPCGAEGKTCTKQVKIKWGDDDNMIITLVRGSPPQVNNVTINPHQRYYFKGGNMFENGMITFISLDSGPKVFWDGGTGVSVCLPPEFRGNVQGLCGDYDGNSNDFHQPNAGLGIAFSNERDLANAFKTQTCTENEEPGTADPCQENSNRRQWAETNCAIISQSEIFKECRDKGVDYNTFTGYCIMDSCRCDSGGDCECMCSAIAAFASACLKVGVCVDWRSQNICPVMCPRGQQYRPCQSPCEQTCGTVSNNTDCDSFTVEGCYCPEGQVRNDYGNCVPIQQCGCIGSDGEKYTAGTVAELQCQTCTCINGSFDCVGPICPLNCTPGEWMCRDGKNCVNLEDLCNYSPQCDDWSDEHDCTYTCEPEERQCVSDGRCLPKTFFCDQEKDCSDGSDEMGCTPDCDNKTWVFCENGACVPQSFLCDGEDDCKDNTDEKNCTVCLGDSYRCNKDMKCLPKMRRCDGVDDCGDGSDEENCQPYYTPEPEMCPDKANVNVLKYGDQSEFVVAIGDKATQDYYRNAEVLLGSPANLKVLDAKNESVLYLVRREELRDGTFLPENPDAAYSFMSLHLKVTHCKYVRLELRDLSGTQVYLIKSPDIEDTEKETLVKFEGTTRTPDIGLTIVYCEPAYGQQDIAIGGLIMTTCLHTLVSTVATTSVASTTTAMITETATPEVVSAPTTTSVETTTSASTPSIVSPGIPSTTTSPATTSVVSPCSEYNIMKRPDTDRTIDSTNPQDNSKLSSGGYEPWTSTPPAGISVDFKYEKELMRIVMSKVDGAERCTATLQRNGYTVQQVEFDLKKRPTAVYFSDKPFVDKVIIECDSSNNTYTEIQITGLDIFVCGFPGSTTGLYSTTSARITTASTPSIVSPGIPSTTTSPATTLGTTTGTTPTGLCYLTHIDVYGDTFLTSDELYIEKDGKIGFSDGDIQLNIGDGVLPGVVVNIGPCRTCSCDEYTTTMECHNIEGSWTHPNDQCIRYSCYKRKIDYSDYASHWCDCPEGYVNVELTAPPCCTCTLATTPTSTTPTPTTPTSPTTAPTSPTTIPSTPTTTVLSPCDEYDIMKRPDTERTIDSTNPQDDRKLSSGGYEPWTSTSPAGISVAPETEKKVMSVEMSRVDGAEKCTVTLQRNGYTVKQVELDTKERPVVADFGEGVDADKIITECVTSSNDTYTQIEVSHLRIFVCGYPEVVSESTPVPETIQPTVVTTGLYSTTSARITTASTPSIVSPGTPSTTTSPATTSVVSPCDEYDIMKRPDTERTIDSTNPQDDRKLSSGGYEPWTSTSPAGISVAPETEKKVMSVEMSRVDGAEKCTVTLQRNGYTVKQVELDTKERPVVADFGEGVDADKIITECVTSSNDTYTQIEVSHLRIFVCGYPAVVSESTPVPETTQPTGEKTTTPQVVSSTSKGVPVIFTGQRTSPTLAPETTGPVLPETTPAAPGTTQPTTTPPVVSSTSEQTTPTTVPETTQPTVAATTSFSFETASPRTPEPKCEEREDIMRRPNADAFIYSSNQLDNSYLLQEDGKMWRSEPYAYFIIKPDKPEDVLSVEIPKVVGAYSVFMIFFYNDTTVAQVERDARNQSVRYDFSSTPTVDKMIFKFSTTNETLTDVQVDNIKVVVCGHKVPTSTASEVQPTTTLPVATTTRPGYATPQGVTTSSTSISQTATTSGVQPTTTLPVATTTRPPYVTPKGVTTSSTPISQTATTSGVQPTTTLPVATTTRPPYVTPKGVTTSSTPITQTATTSGVQPTTTLPVATTTRPGYATPKGVTTSSTPISQTATASGVQLATTQPVAQTTTRPECREYDIMKRPDADRTIDSTNPQENPKLSSGGYEPWTSTSPAGISVYSEIVERWMRVVISKVEGAERCTVALQKNGYTVEQVEVDTSQSPTSAKFSGARSADKCIMECFGSNDTYTEIQIYGFEMYVCGAPGTIPPTTTPPVVTSTSEQTTPSETASPTGPPAGTTVQSSVQPLETTTPASEVTTVFTHITQAPCAEEEDLIRRADALQYITSSNPKGNSALIGKGYGTYWSSTSDAWINVQFPSEERVKSVYLSQVSPVEGVRVILLYKDVKVAQREVEHPQKNVSAEFVNGPLADEVKIIFIVGKPTKTVMARDLSINVCSGYAQTTSSPLITASTSTVSTPRTATTRQIQTTTQPTPHVCSISKLPQMGKVMWIEKDGKFGPTSPDEEVKVGDEVEQGVVVVLDSCTDCTCTNSYGDFTCKKITRELPSTAYTRPSFACVVERCGEMGIEVINKTESCQCAETETLAPAAPPKCCQCVHVTPSSYTVPPNTTVISTQQPTTLPTTQTTAPPAQCHLVHQVGKLRVDDSYGNTCESPEDVVITSCMGSCTSSDKSTVWWVGEKPEDMQHPKQCECCSGVGDWVTHNITCSGKKKPIMVYTFKECMCNACGPQTSPILPAAVNAPAEPLASDKSKGPTINLLDISSENPSSDKSNPNANGKPGRLTAG